MVFVIDNMLQRYSARGLDLIKSYIEVSACMFTRVAFDHHKLNIPNLNLVDVIRNPSLKWIAVNAFSKLKSLLVRHAKKNRKLGQTFNQPEIVNHFLFNLIWLWALFRPSWQVEYIWEVSFPSFYFNKIISLKDCETFTNSFFNAKISFQQTGP